MPGLDVKPMLEELRTRVVEELDYRLEAASQQAFADAFAGDPDIAVPQVLTATDHVLVSEWMDGTPLAEIIASGTQEQRNSAGLLLLRFLFSGPARAGLLHADPHPGNFRLLPDGRLGVLDFGAVDRLPGGLPLIFGRLLWLMHNDGDIQMVERELREHGFLRPGVSINLDELHAFLAPLAEPSRSDQLRLQPGMDAGRGCPGGGPPRRRTSPDGLTCRLPTCSSTGSQPRASAYCASWSAPARSGPRCCDGFPATDPAMTSFRTRPS